MTTFAGEDVEQGEHSFMAGGSTNLYSHFGNQYGGSRKLEINLPQDSEIQLLGTYPKNAQSYTCSTCS